MSGVTLGFKVIYDGEDIGVIETKKVFEDAKALAVSIVNGGDSENFEFKNAKLVNVLTIKNKIVSKQEIAENVINLADDISYATQIFLDGKLEICVSNFDVEAYFDEHLSQYDIKGAENTHKFIDDVEIKKGYCYNEDLSSVADTVKFINKLDVKTTSIISNSETIPYSTLTKKTSMQYVGYSSVITNGINGIKETKKSIVSINGVKDKEKILKGKVVKKPVSEVVLIGTKVKTISQADKNAIKNAGFILPLPKGSYVVTSYFGDGRNHQGLDLAADKGTSIYAVASGTVTFSGSYGNYGYCVIIDHGNGLKTLYAHASRLLVSSGERVGGGQVIANVGTTGRSSGNHLHFELIKNGANLDPAPYIGLR